MPDPTRRLPQHRPQSPRRRDSGQTTAEYALVILAAGTLALAAILWARDSGSITDLFQEVVDRLTGDL
jgi:Flp pilus assembly pilin Flp